MGRWYTKKSNREGIKGDFNLFLKLLIDTYEELKNAKPHYLYDWVLYEDAGEARGKAIMDSVRHKKPAVAPTIMIEIGEDDIWLLKN